MYTDKINPFQVETYIFLEKYEKIIDYMNACNLFPGKIIILIDKKSEDESKIPPQ